MTTYTDDDRWPNPSENWVYYFTGSQLDILEQYLADGRFGLGFDPHCHYYNDGITFTIQTGTEEHEPVVPEPTTLGLCLLGLGGLAGWRRRKNMAA